MEERYAGLCDASAAVAIGQGCFAVADDELDVLRIYRRGAAAPVGSVDLGAYLGNRSADGERDEADIEGSATLGSRIYWISSHARKGKTGALAPHRWRFFATDIIAATPTPTLLPAPTRPANRCWPICWPIHASPNCARRAAAIPKPKAA